jgi:hypothetical protein
MRHAFVAGWPGTRCLRVYFAGAVFLYTVSGVLVHCSHAILLEVLQEQLRRVRHVCAEAAAVYACGKAVDQRVIDQLELNDFCLKLSHSSVTRGAWHMTCKQTARLAQERTPDATRTSNCVVSDDRNVCHAC